MEARQSFIGEKVQINGIEAYYKIVGDGPAIFILHGWGSSSEKWSEVQESLSKQGFQVIVPDLPGFGLSTPPLAVWGVSEYTEFVSKLAEKLGLQKFSLAGHSFGGQIAIQFATNHPEKVEKLILLSAAGVRREPGIKVRIFGSLAKLLNVLLSVIPSEKAQDTARTILYRIVGRSDYARTKGIMRDVMAKVIREDLTHLFEQIKAPTLIIWGDKDKLTPIEDAFLMKKHIKNSFLSILPGVGHRLRVEASEKLIELIPQFLKN